MSAKYKGWTDDQLKTEVARLRAEMKLSNAPKSKEYYRNELRTLARMLEMKNRRF